MKTIAMASMSGELKCPKLASQDENPPKLTVLHMCMKASAQPIPAAA